MKRGGPLAGALTAPAAAPSADSSSSGGFTVQRDATRAHGNDEGVKWHGDGLRLYKNLAAVWAGRQCQSPALLL